MWMNLVLEDETLEAFSREMPSQTTVPMQPAQVQCTCNDCRRQVPSLAGPSGAYQAIVSNLSSRSVDIAT